MGNSSQSFDKFKRAFMDLVHDLHARKLAIPAGVVLVAILAAIFVLPNKPAPPAPIAAAPVADQAQPVQTQSVVALKLVGVSPLDNSVPLTNSTDPFNGATSSKCTRVGNSEPKRFECKVGDLLVEFVCPPGATAGICVTKSSGSTGSTGSSGSAGGTGGAGGGSTPATGGGGGGGTPTTPKKKTTPKTTYYVVGVSLDGRSYSNVIAGDGLPNDKNALAVFAGVTDSHSQAIFIPGDGVTVTGVNVDPDLGNFDLSKGKSATLTDKSGAQHTLTLKSITKVTK